MKDYSKLSKEQLIDELILLGDENLILTYLNECLKNKLDSCDVRKSPYVGQEVLITDEKHGHDFEIGEKVTLLKQCKTGEWKAVNDEKEFWWIEEYEFTQQ